LSPIANVSSNNFSSKCKNELKLPLGEKELKEFIYENEIEMDFKSGDFFLNLPHNVLNNSLNPETL
jgi:hypothetical protein